MATFGPGIISAANLADGAVTAAKLATDAVETAKIKDVNVTAAKLATDAVETAKIDALAVTTAKIAADAVDKDKLGIATTKGDFITYSTEPIRIGIGTNDQVPIADSAQAAGWKWGAAAGGNWTQDVSNTGTTGATDLTISSIASKNLRLFIAKITPAVADNNISIQINGDTGSVYDYMRIVGTTTGNVTGQTSARIATINATNETAYIFLYINSGVTAGKMFINVLSTGNDATTNERYFSAWYTNPSAVLDSIKFISDQTNGIDIDVYGYYNNDFA